MGQAHGRVALLPRERGLRICLQMQGGPRAQQQGWGDVRWSPDGGGWVLGSEMLFPKASSVFCKFSPWQVSCF